MTETTQTLLRISGRCLGNSPAPIAQHSKMVVVKTNKSSWSISNVPGPVPGTVKISSYSLWVYVFLNKLENIQIKNLTNIQYIQKRAAFTYRLSRYAPVHVYLYIHRHMSNFLPCLLLQICGHLLYSHHCSLYFEQRWHGGFQVTVPPWSAGASLLWCWMLFICRNIVLSQRSCSIPGRKTTEVSPCPLRV